MEKVKLILEGVTHLWEEPSIGYVDLLALANKDTNDKSLNIKYVCFIDNEEKERGAIDSNSAPIDLSGYMTEETDGTYIKLMFHSDGSVS